MTVHDKSMQDEPPMFRWEFPPIRLDYYEEILCWASIFDYDPTNFYGPEIGSHWKILKLKGNRMKANLSYPIYLMYYLKISQREMGGPGYTDLEYYYPLEEEFAGIFVADKLREKEERQKERDDESIESVIVQVSEWVGEIDEKLGQYFPNPNDIRNDLIEMIDCAKIGAYRACLAMAGRALEQVLNQMISVNKLTIDNNMGVGPKIGALRKAKVYLDPSTKDIWNVINKQRIAGVHAKDAIPIPSEDEAIMVIFAVKSSLDRLISAPNGTES